MNLHKKLFYSSFILLSAGIAGMVPYANMRADNQAALASAAPVVVKSRPLKPVAISGKPVSISVPSLGLNLPVADGMYDAKNGTWSLYNNQAHFALPSTQPNNEAGNTLIYGHYRREVFASLHNIQPGATAIVTTDNGYKFSYNYTSNETVSPTTTDVFGYQGAPRLTVQTCTGRWYENRQLFYFGFDSVEKIKS